MSNGSSLPSRTRRRNQTRGKWVVVALLLVALIGALLVRNAWKTPLANNAPVVKEGGTDIVSSGGQSAETQPNAIAMVTENTPTAQPPSPDDIPVTIQEPLVENAIIGYDADGNELLTVSGTGDARCTAIRFLLDGTLIGVTIPDTDGNWALTVNQLPTVGNHMSELECEAENGIYTAAPRAFELPQPPIVEPTAVIEEPVIESPTAENNEDENSAETPAADPDPATNPDDNQTESTDPTPEPETPDPAIKQPTVSIAQDLTKYIGGPILLRGEAKADEIIELIFDNGETQIVDTTRANAEGKWHYRGMLTEPGVYAITAQLPGTTAEPTQTVTIPSDVVFGSKGDCFNKTPPFGTIEGDTYIINYCEYFSLIANRLGITFAELRAANQQLINLDYLKAGDTLNIPVEP